MKLAFQLFRLVAVGVLASPTVATKKSYPFGRMARFSSALLVGLLGTGKASGYRILHTDQSKGPQIHGFHPPDRRLLDGEFWNDTFSSTTQARCDQVDAAVAPYSNPAAAVKADGRRPIAEYEPMQGVNVACIYNDSLGNEWPGFGVPVSLLEEIAKDSKLYVLEALQVMMTPKHSVPTFSL